LEVAVQKKLMSTAAARQHDALVVSLLGVHHRALEQVLLGHRDDALCKRECRGEQQREYEALHAQAAANRLVDAVGEHPRGQQRHRTVEPAEQQRGAHQAESRHEHQREQERADQRAHVVEREHLGDQRLEVDLLAQDAHQ
jgi:hypothetical protein